MDPRINDLYRLEDEINFYITEIAHTERDIRSRPAGFNGWQDLSIPLLNREQDKLRLETQEYFKTETAELRELVAYNNRLVDYIATLREQYQHVYDMIEVDELVRKAYDNGAIDDEFVYAPVMNKEVDENDPFGPEFDWIQ